MSWLGNWVGKYLGNWLGLQGSSGGTGVTVNATPVILTLVSTAVLVTSGARHTDAPSTLNITVPAPTVGVGVTIPVTPSVVTISSLAATVSTGAISTAVPSVVVVTPVDPDVELGVVVQASWSGVVLTSTVPTVVNGAVVNPFESSVTISVPAPTVITNVLVSVPPQDLQITVIDPFVRQSVEVAATPSDLSLTSTDPAILLGAIVAPTPVDLQLLTYDPIVVTGAIATIDAVDVFITVVDPKVYDKLGSITYPTSITMRINVPEIIAFSTDITTDMQVVEGIESDMDSVDGTQPVKLLRKTDNVVIDLVLGEAVPENKIYTFPVALVRMISARDNRAVKQLRLFMQSVQNDEMYTMDTIIELPKRDDVEIHTGDIVQTDLTGTKYSVIAIDDCTLKTRWRLGARKLV